MGTAGSHIHLHVRDLERSFAFYGDWFGLRPGARHDDLWFLHGGGLDLALARSGDPAPLPDWFHFGFRLGSAGEVTELRDRMAAAGVEMARDLYRTDDFVSFRVLDPDGHRVEIYWE